MALFNTPVAAVLLSLCVAAAAYTSTPPHISNYSSPAPAPSSPSPSPAPSFDDLTFFSGQDDSDNFYTVPKDEQARDSRYLTAHMTAAVKKVELFLEKEVDGKLKDPVTADYEKECLAICKELYESAAESMKRGMESISAGDFIKANFDVSAFNTDVDTCSDCTDSFQEFDQWAKGVAGDCLDKIVKYTNRF